MILIIDYNVGNIGSIKNMLLNIGVECEVSNDIKKIKAAKKLILPGVGSYDNGMRNLKQLKLIKILNQKVIYEKTPILGICLGMQLMGENSEEGNEKGLGWINQKVKKIEENKMKKLTVPVMGWNYLSVNKKNKILENKIQRFYFVHSYYFPKETKESIASANIGFEYCVAFQKDNIYGVQFHPEKSHNFGKFFFKTFCDL